MVVVSGDADDSVGSDVGGNDDNGGGDVAGGDDDVDCMTW